MSTATKMQYIDIHRTPDKVVSFAGYSRDVCPRRLWQVLFDFYREGGGLLNNMDNMLIDLDNCESDCELATSNSVLFLFAFEPGAADTTWRPLLGDSVDMEFNQDMMRQFGFSRYLICRVREHEAEIWFNKPKESDT